MRIFKCDEYGPPESLKRVAVDTPLPASDEVLVDVDAAGVGFVDGLLIQGLYQVKPPLPYFPGSEFAGVVTAVGEGVDHIEVGDRVLGSGNGAYADQLCAKAHAVYAYPDAMDAATAAGFFINYATALYGLRDCGNLQPGETVLMMGAAGGVGSSAIAVAKGMGARVIAAASTEAKRRAALEFGADDTVDYSDPKWREELKAKTRQSGLHMVYDPVGGDASEAALRSLSPGGRFLVVGFASGTIPKIPLNLALLKRISIVGVDWGGEIRANPHVNPGLMTDLFGMIESGALKPAAVETRPMDELPAALSDQLAGKVIGKLVMVNPASV